MFVGAAKIYLGSHEEAIVWLRRSIEANRNNPLSHVFLAAALAVLGRPDEARAAARAALSLNPHAAELYPRKLLLPRPDRHVAWRGDRPPDDPLTLIDRVRGALAGEAVLQRAQAPTFALDRSSRLSAAQPVT